MATNPYLKKRPNYPESNLYEGIIIEAIQWAGDDVYYLPRTLNKFDQVYGEDNLSSFDSAILIEVYINDFTGYGGEGHLLSKFGMEIRDTASFIIARKRYLDVVSPQVPDSRNEILKIRPNEGDLIYVPISKSLFEIKFVEDEVPFYQTGKKFIWELDCELFQINNERFNTGVEEIDYFNKNINRLGSSLTAIDGSYLIAEDGGRLLSEDYEEAKPFDDLIGAGDNAQIRQEFLDIVDFTADSPFGDLI